MATYSKEFLSGSTNGRGILVAATAIASGTTIHTAITGAIDMDLVTLFVQNNDSLDRVLTIGFGGTTSPNDLITLNVPPQAGLVPVAIDLPIQNGLLVRAAGAVTNMLVIFGSVKRIDKP